MNNYSQTTTHYETRVECFAAPNPQSLAGTLNRFYEGKFNVGTQTHFDAKANAWIAFAYYKVKA
jgi:hypothetical protein